MPEQHLALNVSTTNNLIVDFRTGQLRIHEFCLHRLNGGGVNKFMFLDMQISEELSWAQHNDAIMKGAQQHVYFIKRLRGFCTLPTTLLNFYRL